MELKPMICEKCGTVNPIQEMVNTAQCLVENCYGLMKYIDEEIYVETKIKQE